MQFKIDFNMKKIFSSFLVCVIFFFLQGGHEAQNVQTFSLETINFYSLFFFSFLYFSIAFFLVYKFIFKPSFFLLLLFNLILLLHAYINFNSLIIYSLIIFLSNISSMSFFYFLLKCKTKEKYHKKNIKIKEL